MAKTRIEYIDCLRGLLIIFVIYGHLVGPLNTNNSLPFGTFYMPLFFFISGLVSSTIPEKNIGGGVDWFKNICISRFFMILVPSLAISTTEILIKGKSLSILATSGTGPRAWFTFTLFFIFIFYAIVGFLLNKKNVSKRGILITFITISMICVLFHAYFTLTKSSLLGATGFIGFFDFPQMAHYIPYFLMGVVAKMYNEEFFKMLQNNVIVTLTFALWLALIVAYYFIPQVWHLWWTFPVLSTLGIFVMYHVFYQYQEVFSSQTIVGRLLSFLGKYTLGIYLLHFNFIHSLKCLETSQLIECTRNSAFLEIIILTAISIIIALFCILIDKFIASCPPIHKIFYGFNPMKKVKTL